MDAREMAAELDTDRGDMFVLLMQPAPGSKKRNALNPINIKGRVLKIMSKW